MKRIITLLFISLSVMCAMAQPSTVKKAAKGVIKVTTFKADGTINATGFGVFTDADGTAIAAWKPFEGATSAIVIDGQGKKYDVDCLYGASQIYNVAKLRVKKQVKSSILPVPIEQGQQSEASEVWLLSYDVKSPGYAKFNPSKVETFMGDMPYYVFEQEEPKYNEENAGSPFFNAQGQLIGLLNTSKTRTDLYAASARYALTLAPSMLSMNDNTLRNTSIRIALPTDYNQAIVALMVAAQRNDSINYPATIDEFITMFPDKEDGYISKAEMLTSMGNFAEADKLMQTAIEKSETKDNAHYSFSKLIYSKETMMSQMPYDGWSLDKAVEEIDIAYGINPLVLYRIHKGKILYAQEKYAEALTEFQFVNTSEMQDADVYYYAYQCMKMLDSDKDAQLAQLDSCVSLSPNAVIYQAERTLLLMKMGKKKEALEMAKNMVTIAPYYAEGHGLLGLALCLNGNSVMGITELRRAKAMGYDQADAFLEKYARPAENTTVEQTAGN